MNLLSLPAHLKGRPARLLAGGLAAVWLAVSLVMASPWQVASHVNPERIDENQVMAVYLYNFLNFVTWPDSTPPTKDEQQEPMTIGVLGDTQISKALTELAAELIRQGKPPIRLASYPRYAPGLRLDQCHILLVSDSEKENFTRIIKELKRAPVLTVGLSDDFLAAGGMIAMVERQNRVRYAINRRAVGQAGLQLSAQLLKSAVEIKDE
ncbi:MAG: YfiR family protein [Desulfobacteraceae bacterium]|nr:YfiR family protein [Desulfobacteraceae bacterium]